MNSSCSLSFTFCPPKSGRRTLSPTLTQMGTIFPSESKLPGPASTTTPYEADSVLLMMIPEEVLVCGSSLRTTILLRRGRIFLKDDIIIGLINFMIHPSVINSPLFSRNLQKHSNNTVKILQANKSYYFITN